MVFSSTRVFTASWTCLSMSLFTWLTLLPPQVDAGNFMWPWLCDVVTEHYDRLQQRGRPRNVIAFHTIFGNFSYIRVHDGLHNNSCDGFYMPPDMLERCLVPTPYKVMEFDQGSLDLGRMGSRNWCFKGNWSMADGESRLRFGFKGPNQHWESVIHRGDFDAEPEI